MRGRTRVTEILVCAAIILIVCWSFYAGVVSPSCNKAKESACASNIHQLALALTMYCSDYDGTLPPIPNQLRDSWFRVLRAYALSDEAKKHSTEIEDVCTVKPYFCPSRVDKGYSSGMNWYVAGRLLDSNADPVKVILLAEASGITDEDWWVFDGGNQVPSSSGLQSQSHPPLYSIHPAGANVAFLDGHMSTCKRAELSIENWLVY